MSASTRTVQQQSLGNGQIWAALAVVTLALIVALVIAFGSRTQIKAPAAPAVGNPPPAVIDHGWSQAGTSKGIQSTPVDHGSSEASMYAGPSSQDIDGIDKGVRDAAAATRGGFRGDPGYAPRATVKAGSGHNGARLAQ